MNLENLLTNYKNTEAINNRIFVDFTNFTNSIDYLKDHRDYIESNSLGFGDRAFQYMWYLILKYLNERQGSISALEIGVFKGQIISLWSLIAQKENIALKINCITPLEGNPALKNKILSRMLKLVSKKYRENNKDGNHYERENYLEIIGNLFQHFKLSFSEVNLIKGYSNDPNILSEVENSRFDLIYIDGDHSYEGAKSDIITFSKKTD